MYGDWYPRARDEQVHLVDAWVLVFLTVVGPGNVTKGTLWGIPDKLVQDLMKSVRVAKEILAVVKSGERTSVNVAECNAAFRELEAEARYIKKHWLISPPLTEADLASLLLNQEDSTYSPIPAPTGQPMVAVTYPGGPHVLKLHLEPLAGTEPLDRRSEYGYAVYKGVMPPGGATLEQAAGVKHYLMKAPRDGDELLHYRFTRRKTEIVGFPADEAGMTAYFCARYENKKGDEGKWGPVAQAIVP
jgi:hypothetical protein